MLTCAHGVAVLLQHITTAPVRVSASTQPRKNWALQMIFIFSNSTQSTTPCYSESLCGCTFVSTVKENMPKKYCSLINICMSTVCKFNSFLSFTAHLPCLTVCCISKDLEKLSSLFIGDKLQSF